MIVAARWRNWEDARSRDDDYGPEEVWAKLCPCEGGCYVLEDVSRGDCRARFLPKSHGAGQAKRTVSWNLGNQSDQDRELSPTEPDDCQRAGPRRRFHQHAGDHRKGEQVLSLIHISEP